MRKRVAGLGFVGLAALLLAGACGGGGGGDGDGQPPVVLAGLSTSVAALDGWVRTDGSWNAADSPRTGDFDASVPGEYVTAYYTFEFGGLTPGAQILGATLDVEVVGIQGAPHVQHGDLLAHFAPYGGSLGNAVTTVVVDPPPPAVFSPSIATLGVKRADVTTLLQRAVDDGLTRLQVQVSCLGPFAVNNSVDDYVQLSDGENVIPGATVPTLAFQWTAP
jgi:hypothetical protein